MFDFLSRPVIYLEINTRFLIIGVLVLFGLYGEYRLYRHAYERGANDAFEYVSSYLQQQGHAQNSSI